MDTPIGKYAVAISTSINFYDNTAHNYINAISDDLGMKYIDYFSAHMGLLNEKGGDKKLLGFADYIFDCMLSGVIPAKNYEKITGKSKVFQNCVYNGKKIMSAGKIAVIADMHDTSLDNMIACLKDSFSEKINISYLSDFSIKGGCRGCLKCGPANNCFYDKKGLKIIFRADHRNYKRTGVYDFPQKNIFKTIFYHLGYLITSMGFIQKRMIDNMPDFMIRAIQAPFCR